jgi:hypothetical protein
VTNSCSDGNPTEQLGDGCGLRSQREIDIDPALFGARLAGKLVRWGFFIDKTELFRGEPFDFKQIRRLLDGVPVMKHLRLEMIGTVVVAFREQLVIEFHQRPINTV